MRMKTCIIFGNADISDYSFIRPISAEDFVISADGGWRHLKKIGHQTGIFYRRYGLASGNHSEDIKKCYQPEKIPILFIAVKKGLSLGCEKICFLRLSRRKFRTYFVNIRFLILLPSKIFRLFWKMRTVKFMRSVILLCVLMLPKRKAFCHFII